MVYYKPVKVIINALYLINVIIDKVVRHHGLLNSIVIDQKLLFTLKFWLLLCYFLGIKQKLSITFYLQMDGKTKRQNGTIKAYLLAFVNFEQNDKARLLLIAAFTYNNAKNTSTAYTLFELNCRYHPWFSYKKDLNPFS